MPALRLRSIFDKQMEFYKCKNLHEFAITLIAKQNNSVNKNELSNWLETLRKNSLVTPLPMALKTLLLHKTFNGFISFLVPAIMFTTGLTNAGFIILLFTGAATLTAVTMGATLGVGLAFAIPGAFLSGYAQKGIYQESLEGLVEMIMDGTYARIARENPKLFAFATLSALCSFLVNFGLGLVGMSVFLASGGAPVIILAFLFAIANAFLVYYTALDQINKKDQFHFSAMKPSLLNTLTIIFGVIASFGLIMLFFPGAAAVTKKLSHDAGIAVFSVLLFFAALTEAFYSWVKSHHLALHICTAVKNPSSIWENKEDIVVTLVNAAINGAPGGEGGVELGNEIGVTSEEQPEKHATLVAAGVTSTANWSATCSAATPQANTQDAITHQFSQFIKNNNKNTAFEFNENKFRSSSLTF